eukprot:TRINITY_DN39745_c0_g1_i1.p1 TRINITY_DN39745_c0_g1~~TRINITY_DN39745_c0_g1_i1.p1  ORF type:complete len:199 (+),score=37.26 TRINITY_DN39745_c0_g1_i1:119-715(+)
MGDDGAGQGAGGRPNLPGIPGYIDRVSAEEIWKYKCNSELQYVQERTRNPPKTRDRLGVLHGFEVIRKPSYVDIRPRHDTPVGSRVGTASMTGGDWAPGSRSATPGTRSLVAPTARDQLAEELYNNSLSAKTRFATAIPKVIPVPTTNFVIPKYRFAWSMDHMHALQAAPNSCKSAKGLQKAISTPAVNSFNASVNIY